MTTSRTRSAKQFSDHTHRLAGMWVVAVTTGVLALASLLVMTSTAAAGRDPGCPPPSAQLNAAQPSAQSTCAALDGPHLTSTPIIVDEPLDVAVNQTPTGTTTLPATTP